MLRLAMKRFLPNDDAVRGTIMARFLSNHSLPDISIPMSFLALRDRSIHRAIIACEHVICQFSLLCADSD